MLSRGVICEINGCISTGKEVRGRSSVRAGRHSPTCWSPDRTCVFVSIRPTFITPARRQERTGPSRSTRRPSCCSRTATNTSAGSSGGPRTTEEEFTKVKSFCSVQILFLSSGAANWAGLILWRLTEPPSSVALLLLLCRFRHGYCKGNPRKMVRTWAEKEMRNLIRSEDRTQQNPV